MYRTFITLPYSIMGEYNRLSKAHYFIYIFNLSFFGNYQMFDFSRTFHRRLSMIN